ncbi:protein kinase family protein [Listeria monocytogenes]|uniref:protein kinase family protein n=1 Tax=Listeria TaxID=1637 RepID=UPI000EC42B63|nr:MULTISPECIES: protein kinase family protein [Listeria]EHW7496083.1 protein kinase family protein [Listeria monocytogenes]EIA7375815.1 protein kinase family protein [Listeria monocytogenes]EIA7384763.1 protein kinase family protein [Listeria monocytogenes]EIA7778285.1 protein kinase family protein [Listeria monocytogenes]EIA8016971.1 protein kinase family protein [Listeria monocytogenes]
MIRIENYIESQFIEIQSFKNIEYISLYESIMHEKLKVIFSSLHKQYILLFKSMNTRLPTKNDESYFWAESSRELINIIDITKNLLYGLKDSEYAFFIDEYYFKVICNCEKFLSGSGGSTIPVNTEKITVYYTIPIFTMSSTISIDNLLAKSNYQLKSIGEGSYAKVYKYFDCHYNRSFVIKKALKNLNDKELLRFKQEFDFMNECNSPYIVDVYNFNIKDHEYTMELMDCTLKKYMEKNINKISFVKRKNMGYQILKAFEYIHSKKSLHRDISPNNVLIKNYDDVLVLKISDFGLVKTPNLKFTSLNTEFKGWFNDPALITEGFHTYTTHHETYALTRLLTYIITGKTNISKIKNNSLKEFIKVGLNKTNENRYQDIRTLKLAFSKIQE